jgi:hypothetical protein
MSIRLSQAAHGPTAAVINEADRLQATINGRGLLPPLAAAILGMPDHTPLAHRPATPDIQKKDIGKLRVFAQFRSCRRL